MTDDPKENTPDAGATATETPAPEAPAPETPANGEGGGGEAPQKLRQTVEMSDVGPCRKYIKVPVSRDDIASRVGDKIKGLVGEAQVPGFRPGKAPRKIIEKRFQRDVQQQVKTEILLASLE